jgi:tetratricopeptide (TPR) repeat protein
VHAHGPRVRRRGLAVAGAVRRRSAIAAAQIRTGIRIVARAGAEHGSAAVAHTRRGVTAAAKVGADHGSRAGRQLTTSARGATSRMQETAARTLEHVQTARASAAAPPIDLHREALRLNAAGTRQRRRGAYSHAVVLHRRALGILGGLDDARTVALTQNNLALALSHVGDESSAIALFQEAAATLHDLGEQEQEGQIIANLGLAHRRHGRYEESADVLQLALTKLPPSSRAYATVEAELERAS